VRLDFLMVQLFYRSANRCNSPSDSSMLAHVLSDSMVFLWFSGFNAQLNIFCYMLQNICAAGTFPFWVGIHKRDLFFSRVELHPSLDIHLCIAFRVSLDNFFVWLCFHLAVLSELAKKIHW
jgi:hypothetical protein